MSSVPFEQLLGIQVLQRQDGRSRLLLPYRKELTNPYGIMHGGAIVSLIDSAMAAAIFSIYPQNIFYTAKLEINFKSPVREGNIFVEAETAGRKKDFISVRSIVRDGQGKLVAEAKAAFYLGEKI